MSEIELKPCPFCGGKINKFIAPLQRTVMFVCEKCGADIFFYGAEHEPKATKAWNKRAGEITNYEKIKNLTVEEMVEFIICEGACNYCIYADDDNCKGAKCKEGVTAWLEQEVTDND